MPAVHESEIDGVLCFWSDTGRPLSSAHLLFRQGLADEPLHETGWLHLLEHLALLDRETLSRPIHGSVSMLLTRFDVYGTSEQVTGRLEALSRWLADPDFRLLARERGVLQADAQRRADPVARSMPWRYGAVGPGVTGFMEAGAVRATPELLTERCQRVFNSANAILVLDGEPPASLKLPMCGGEYQPPTAATPLARRLPAAYVDDSGMTLSGVVRRGHAATFLPGILERAVHDGLRQRTGGAYAPWSDVVEVDDQFAVVAGGSDVVPETMDTVAEAGVDILRHLAEDGVPRPWLHEAVEARLKGLQGNEASFQAARTAAYAALSGRVPQSLEELIDELRETDPEQVDEVLRELWTTLLVGLPEGARPADEVPLVTFPESEPGGVGPRHRHVNWPAEVTTFAVDDQAVETGTVLAARRLALDEVVALLSWRDGTRQVVGRDGSVVEMEARQWYGGAALAEALDQAVPAELHLPMPDRTVTFRRMGLPQRLLFAFARWSNTKAGLVTMLSACALIGLYAVIRGHGELGTVFLLLCALLGAQLWRVEGGLLPRPAGTPDATPDLSP